MEKILWICKESFTSLVNFSIPHFPEFENEAIFIHPTESLLKDETYMSFIQQNESLKIHDLNDLSKFYAEKFTNGTIEVDYKLISAYEEKYCQNLSWGKVLMSSQIFTTPYHYRFYFKDLNEDEKNYWVLLLFKYFENFIEKSKPSYIFDFDNSEIGRTILWLVASYHAIPYVCLEHTRYKGIIVPNFNLGRKVDSYFLDYFKINKDSEFLDEVVEFRKLDQIINKDYENNKTTKKKNNSLIKDLKRLFYCEKTVYKKFIRKNKILGSKVKFPFIASFKGSFIFFIKSVLRERFLLSTNNPYFTDPVEGEKYIYFPLHLIPESSTLIKAPNFPNEEDVIARIAKSLPAGWKLYIKEHGAMIGERPLNFYKKNSRLSNVEFIKLDAYDDPKTWILNSMGVITITGTSAFEAVMLGKPAIVLGTVPFEMVKGINVCEKISDLDKVILNQFRQSSIDNLESCENYLNTIYKFGEKVEFTLLHNLSLRALVDNDELSQKGKNQIAILTNVFRKALEISNRKS